jgi:hypothetical protein
LLGFAAHQLTWVGMAEDRGRGQVEEADIAIAIDEPKRVRWP